MKKTTKTSLLAITIVLIAIVWICAVSALTTILDFPRMCWGSISCTVLAVIIVEIYLMILKKDLNAQSTEDGALTIIITLIFFIVTLLINSALSLLRLGNFNVLLITLNFAIIAGYIILIIWAEHRIKRLAECLAQTEFKSVPSKEISRKLGELLAISEDADIRAKLLKLKEAVDYSTNISTSSTVDKDSQMNSLLDEIVQLTLGRSDRMIILNKIDTAEMIWKMRSSIASSTR